MKYLIHNIILWSFVWGLSFAESDKIPIRFNPNPNAPEPGRMLEAEPSMPDANASKVGDLEGKAKILTGTVDALDKKKGFIRIKDSQGTITGYKLTKKTEIMVGETIGKLSDIKVGNSVSFQVDEKHIALRNLHIEKP